MLANIHEAEPDLAEHGVAMGAIEMVAVLHRIAALHAGPLVVERLEARRVARNRRKQPQVGLGFDVHPQAHFRPRMTILLERAVLWIKDPLVLPVRTHGWAIIGVRRLCPVVAMMPHATETGTQGGAVRIERDGRIRVHLRTWQRPLRGRVLRRRLRVSRRGVRLRGRDGLGVSRRWSGVGLWGRGLCGRARGNGMVLQVGLGLGRVAQRDNRNQALLVEIAIQCLTVVMPVAGDIDRTEGQVELLDELEQVVERLRSERKVGLIALAHHRDQREIVSVHMQRDGQGPVAETPFAVMAVFAPLGGGAGILAGMVAVRVAGLAVAGLLALRRRGGFEDRAVAVEHLWRRVVAQTGLQRWEQPQLHQQVLQAGVQGVRIARRFRLLQQPVHQRGGLGRVGAGLLAAGLRGVLQPPAVASFQRRAPRRRLPRADGVWAIGDARQEVPVRGRARHIVRRKTRQDGQQRIAAQLLDPGVGAMRPFPGHQQPGAQHRRRVARVALVGGAIEGSEAVSDPVQR